MFKRINSVYHTKLYKNFNSENELYFDVKINGAQPFEEKLWIEPMSTVALTERDGYVGCCFADLCYGEINNFGVGVFLDAAGEILISGCRAAESFRKKITGNEGVIIKSEEYSACFYPVIQNGFDTYIEYDGKNNSVGFISVKNGLSKPGIRNISKFGCSFSLHNEFYYEDADLNLFNECSFLTLWTMKEECI